MGPQGALRAFLLHAPGVKNEYVAHILAKYPTFALLKRALDSHSLEEPRS